MTAREKIDAAIDYLTKRGVHFNSSTPPHYRLLWALGFPLAPPHFQSFLGLFAFNGVFFGVTFGLMAFLFERHHAAAQLALVASLVGGTTVGLLMAVIYRVKARWLGLPRWSEFPQTRTTDDEADAGW